MTPSYYVLLLDYGRNGLEANVHPEDTRRGIVDRAVEAMGDHLPIVLVHHVTFNGTVPQIEDVTEEIVSAAENERDNRAEQAWERHCEAFHDGGSTQFKSLQQQQIEAMRLK